MQQTFQIPSNQDGLLLHGLYTSAAAPKAIVQIAHGMAEHKERYLPFMEYLSQHGFVVFIHDHRGHGGSVKQKEDLGHFYDASARYIVEDLHQVMEYAQTTFPGLPHFLFAHSMGTLVTRCMLQDYDAQVDGVILSGAVAPNPLVGASLVLNRVLNVFYGEHHRSRLLNDLAFRAFAKAFPEPSAFNWLNRDAQQVALYEQDPLCGYLFTLDGFYNLSKLVKRTYTAARYQVRNPALPLLFLAGSEDPVIAGANGFANEIQFLKQRGYHAIERILYPGMRHEILLEQDHERVYADVLAFLENHTIST